MKTYKQIINIENNYLGGFYLPKDFNAKKVEITIKKIEIAEIQPLKLSEKYKNVFSKEDAISFDIHSQNTRNEWGII